MDNTIYITLSRQLGLFRDMETTANNIANVNTPGYNAQKLIFSEYLVDDKIRKNAFANDPSNYRDTSNGAIKMTNNQFDLAINGPGYFQVETALGRRYTRAGNFQINAEGTVVTSQGYPVLGGDGGQINIPETAKNVAINGAGQVSVDGEDVGQVGVVEFANPQAMTRMGNTMYSTSQEALPGDLSRVVQGALETSNVNPVTEMVKVMDISRSVNSSAKFIEVVYDLERKVSNVYTKSQSA